MATRSRTLLYLNFRNAYYLQSGKRNKYVDASESAGLMQNKVAETSVVEMSAIPPKW
jgi:hypothetical protein